MERTIAPTELRALVDQPAPITLLDVRRADDRTKEPAAIPGADWQDPAAIDEWRGGLRAEREIVLYFVRGGSVSNSVLDTLSARGL